MRLQLGMKMNSFQVWSKHLTTSSKWQNKVELKGFKGSVVRAFDSQARRFVTVARYAFISTNQRIGLPVAERVTNNPTNIELSELNSEENNSEIRRFFQH